MPRSKLNLDALRESKVDSGNPDEAGNANGLEPSTALHRTKNRLVRWQWNLPLLLGTVVVLLVIGLGSFVVYSFRSAKVAEALSLLAENAKKENNSKAEVKWLTQLRALDSDYEGADYRLAVAIDEASSKKEAERARRGLLNGLAAEGSMDAEQSKDLRRRLIKRLIEMQGAWVSEAERQVILLNADVNDGEATQWLAQSLIGQVQYGEWKKRDSTKFDQATDYWSWLASQPVGRVLEIASEKNPDGVELRVALLQALAEPEKYFPGQNDDSEKEVRIAKVESILESFRESSHPEAWWAYYYFRNQTQPETAAAYLEQTAPKALKRLQSPSQSDPSSERKEGQRSEMNWESQVAIAFGEQLEKQGKSAEALKWYHQLIDVEPSKFSTSLTETLFARASGLCWSIQLRDECIALLEEGSKRMTGSDGLNLYEMLAAYAGQERDIEYARQRIEQLDEIIALRGEFLRSTPLHSAYRESEQSKLNQVKWHSEVLKGALEVRSGNYGKAVTYLNAATTTQQPIPVELRTNALRQLAQAHGSNGMWDLAAKAMDDAVALNPEDKALRQSAAETWLRAGAAAKAESDIIRSDNGSFDSALSILLMTAASENALPPARRDPGRVEHWFGIADKRRLEETAAGKPPERGWLIESYQLNRSRAAASNSSDQLEDSYFDLAKRYSKVAQLQSMVLVEFAHSKQTEKLEEIRSQLDTLREVEPQWWLVTQLKLALRSGDKEKAERIVEDALAVGLLKPNLIRQVAATCWEEIGDLRRACDFSLVDLDSKTDSELFASGSRLFSLLKSEESKLPSNPTGQNHSARSQLIDIVNRLKKIEGLQGSRWKWLEASVLLFDFTKSQKPSLVEDGAKLISQVLVVRPRWAEALTLAADYAVAQSRLEAAVDLYRRAISEGDQRVSTTFQLVLQLDRLRRTEESEQEFQRIAGLAERFDSISKMSIGLQHRKGNFDEALSLARNQVEKRKLDAAAWLVLSQVASAKAETVTDGRKELLSEAEKGLDEAIRLTEGKDVNVWLSKIRFAARFRGTDTVKAVVGALSTSPAPERTRMIVSARSYLQLNDPNQAKSTVEAALVKFPQDADLMVILADCYRELGEPQLAVESLERAYQVDPNREEIRRTLALALTTMSPVGAPIPWSRVASLVGRSTTESSDTNQFFHAMLLSTRGEAKQIDEAMSLLQSLFNSREKDIGINALRLAITIELKKLTPGTAEANGELRDATEKNVKRLFDLLLAKDKLTPNDYYQYADFLMKSNRAIEVPRMIDRIDSMTSGSPQSLDLRIRLAKSEGRLERIPTLVAEWIKQGKPGMLAEGGKILLESGFNDQAIAMLQQAYESDPKAIRTYIAGLIRVERYSLAADVCLAELSKQHSSEFATFLADIAIAALGKVKLGQQIDSHLRNALERYPDNARLIELVGTLRLFEQKYDEAYELLTRSESLSPKSVFTLNNMAIVASEIKGKENEGLEKIEKAIQLYGRLPDLLDTLAIVQLKCGRLKEAEASIREAMKSGQDPRTILHLMQIVEASGNQQELRQLYPKLNTDQLQKLTLLASEQQALERFTRLYGAEIAPKEDSP